MKKYLTITLYVLCCFACVKQAKQLPAETVYTDYDIKKYEQYEELTLPDSLLPQIKLLEEQAKERNDLEVLSSTTAILSVKKIREGNFEEGFRMSEDFLEHIVHSQHDLKLISATYFKTGRTFFVIGMPSLGLNYFIKSAETATSSADYARALYAIAHSSSLSQDQKCIDPIEYYRLAMEQAEIANDSIIISQCLFGISQEYFKSLQAYEIKNEILTDKKKDSINTAIDYLKKASDYNSKPQVHGFGIGLNYAALKDFDRAQYYIYKETERDKERTENSAMVMNVIACMYTCMGDYTAALEYAEKANALAKTQHKEDDIRNSSSLMYYIHKYAGNYEQALESFEAYEKMQEELINRSFEQEHIISEVRYDTKIKEELLAASQQKNELYDKGIKIITLFLICIMLLATLLYYYYQKIKKANKELVRKNQEWAENNIIQPAHRRNNGEAVSQEQHLLIGKLTKLYEEEKVYLEPELTINDLTHKLDTNRTYLSEAINKAYGKNFNTYTNEYRVKEAIKLFSDPANDCMTIEAVAARAGFNNRSSFYISFKKITGLPPTAFKHNIS